jgi:succinate dehydrogenase / fumarate reductase cytochrome b subunit
MMAVTGLVLICFLLMHCFGNLKLLLPGAGKAEFNEYAEFLKGDILYPIVPHGWFIWIFRLVLLVCAVLHMYSAIVLWQRASKATPGKYAVHKALAPTYSYAARTQRWGGIILALLLIWHLIQFTIAPQAVNGQATPADNVIAAFSQWYYVLIYAVFMAVVCLHVMHGFWSAFATLGANTSAKAQRVLSVLAHLISILLFVGFLATPIAILGGLVA